MNIVLLSRKMKFIFIGSISLFIGFFFWSPYWVMYKVQESIEKNDTNTLVKYVDFYTLQSNTKNTLKHFLDIQTEKNKANNEAQRFGQLMFMAFIGQIIERMVTPEGLVLILKGKALSENLDPEMIENDQTAKSTDAKGNSHSALSTTMHYESLNRFILTIQVEKQATSMDFVFYRDGLFSWKLADIRFNMDKLTK